MYNYATAVPYPGVCDTGFGVRVAAALAHPATVAEAVRYQACPLLASIRSIARYMG